MTRYDMFSAGYTIEGGKPVVSLFARDEHRDRYRCKDRTFKPFFYGGDPTSSLLDILNRPVRLVETRVPGDVPQYAKNYDYTCETKIPFELRYLISKGIKAGFEVKDGMIKAADPLGIEPRKTYLDFEMVSPPEIQPRPLTPNYPIVNAGFFDSYTNLKFLLFLLHENPEVNISNTLVVRTPNDLKLFKESITKRLTEGLWSGYDDLTYFATERLLFAGMQLVTALLDGDVLAGWYSNFFDLPYWFRRAWQRAFPVRMISPIKKVAAPYNEMRGQWRTPIVRGRQCCDLIQFYKTLTKPEGQKFTYDLKWIVGKECDLVFEDLGDRIEIFWGGQGETKDGLSGHKALVEYGRKELDALKAIDEHRGLISEFERRRRIFGSFLQDSHIALRNHISILHREAPRPLPTFEFHKDAELKGAIVGEVIRRGLEQMVGVVDIHGMYTNIIVGKNLSFETKFTKNLQTVFKRKPQGFIPRLIEKLQAERDVLRNQRKDLIPDSGAWDLLWSQEQSFKYAVKSLWGVMKHLDIDIAREVTGTGRQVLTSLMDGTRKAGYDVLYYDTDSEFFKLHTEDWKEGLEVEKLTNEILLDISSELDLVKPFTLEYEKCYDQVFLHAPKHYIAHVIMRDGKETDFFEYKGVARRRSDSAQVTIDVWDKFFEALMVRRNEREALGWLEKAVIDFGKYPPSYIAIPKGLNQPLHAYKKKNPWIRGVENSVRLFKFRFRQDKKPLLLYCYHPAKEICFPDYETADAYRFKVGINLDKMIEKTLRKKFKPFVEALGYTWSSVFDKRKLVELSRWIQ